MKKILSILMLLIVICSTCAAQPRWYKSKRFWIGAAIVAGSSLADGITTQRCLAAHACVEEDPLLGHHPSTSRIFMQGAAFDFVESYLSYKLKPLHGNILIGITSITEVTFAIRTLRRPIFVCSPEISGVICLQK